MTRTIVSVVTAIVAVVSCTAAATLYGIRQERYDLDRLLQVLALQLSAELSKTAALPSLLASHSLVDRVLRQGQAKTADRDYLDQLVLQTGQLAFALIGPEGRLIVAGSRNPDRPAPVHALTPDRRTAISARGLQRRFVPHEGGKWVFEVALAVRRGGPEVIGFVVAVDALEDLTVHWRAMPDRLTLHSADDGLVLATEPFEQLAHNPLRALQTLGPTGTTLSLERHPRVLVPYALSGGSLSALALAAAFFAVASVRTRRALLQHQVASLARNTMELEQRVQERTRTLRTEIEHRRQTEAELRDSQAQLVQTAKFKVLGQMAAGLSHEISQPLFALQSALGTLEKQLGVTDGAAQSTLRKAQGVALRMDRILNNLRNFARQETEAPQPTDVVADVDAALGILSARIAQTQAQVRHHSPATPLFCKAGSVRLQQVIVNLVSNALDAVPHDGSGVVTIDYETDQTMCQIAIRDNGSGVDCPDQAMQPFVTTKGDQHGLGLGLSVSSDLIHSFAGSIRLANLDAGGAEVLVKLPLCDPEAIA